MLGISKIISLNAHDSNLCVGTANVPIDKRTKCSPCPNVDKNLALVSRVDKT